MKKISAHVLKNFVDNANTLLASEMPQSAKSTLCCMVEGMLFGADCYAGYNNVYWLKTGCDHWHDGKPDFPEKLSYICGPDGAKNRDNDNFMSDIQGEYARYYYTGKIK